VKNNISNSRKIVGQNDYKFNRVNKTKQVLNKDVRFTSKMIKKDVKFVETKIDNYNNDVRGGSVKTITSTTSPLVSSIGGKNIDKRFAQSVLDGFQSFGCKFIQNEFRTLSSQLQGMQNAGESGSNVNAKVRKIKFLYNFGQKRGCWNKDANGHDVNNVNEIGGNVPKGDPRSNFQCKKSGSGYGVKKINGLVRGDIKRPL